MAEKLPGDYEAHDPLEQLLDEESDAEFGLPEFRDHLADSLTPAVLKDWTAADFASIYVRFRPHLERHAKRFLVNPSQVEEVVQDAFLYLMTTLPELDSELGVLKFLKWKTRLLALDVIRANSRASFAPIDEQPEFAAKGEELSADLERADDAAIVALAMAKLQPRHREALIATLYEEKSNEVVAAQMGLNENAFRQLLFRARSAFKKALVGEAETQGKSVSEILSIAARKAAKDSGRYISAAGAFLLVLAISIGVIPNLSTEAPEQFAAEPLPVQLEIQPEPETEAAPLTSEQVEEVVASEVVVEAPQEPQISQVAVISTPSVEAKPEAPATVVRPPSVKEQNAAVMRNQLGDFAAQTLSLANLTQTAETQVSTAGSLTVFNDAGLSAAVAYDLNTESGIQHTWLTLKVQGQEFVAVPKVSHSEKRIAEDGSITLSYIATDLIIGDVEGAYGYVAIEDSVVSRSGVRIIIQIAQDGTVLSADLDLTQRS